MSKTLANAEPTKLQKSLQYRPPHVDVGSRVIYYPTPGNPRNYTIAFVKKTGEKALELVTMEGGHFEQVRHLTDPRVTEARIAQAGAWDFTPDHAVQAKVLKYIEQAESHFGHLDSEVKALWSELKQFMERFEKLRRKIESTPPKPQPAKSATDEAETGSTKAASPDKKTS